MPRATRSSSNARQAASLSPPMLRRATSTFWPSRRTPRATRTERLVALLSTRTRTTVPSRMRRTISSPARSRFCHASQSACTLCQARLTVSLPTAPPNSAAERAAHPPGVGAGKIGPGNQRLRSLRQPLVGRQRLAVPFLWLAIAASQSCPRHRDAHRPERAEKLTIPMTVPVALRLQRCGHSARRPSAADNSDSSISSMNERICWRTPASRGSNQSAPRNGTSSPNCDILRHGVISAGGANRRSLGSAIRRLRHLQFQPPPRHDQHRAMCVCVFRVTGIDSRQCGERPQPRDKGQDIGEHLPRQSSFNRMPGWLICLCRAERLVEPRAAYRLQDHPAALQGRQANRRYQDFVILSSVLLPTIKMCGAAPSMLSLLKAARCCSVTTAMASSTASSTKATELTPAGARIPRRPAPTHRKVLLVP